MRGHRLLHARKAGLTSVGPVLTAGQTDCFGTPPPATRFQNHDNKTLVASEQLSVFRFLVCPGSFACVPSTREAPGLGSPLLVMALRKVSTGQLSSVKQGAFYLGQF